MKRIYHGEGVPPFPIVIDRKTGGCLYADLPGGHPPLKQCGPRWEERAI